MIQHLTAIWKFRHFLTALVRLDLRLRYKRSVFGIGWSLLNPIAMTIVFCVVFSSLLGNGNWKAYAPFLLAGMAVWGFIRDSALTGCRALISNESYIRQSPLPFAIYSLRTVAGQAIHFLIAMVVVLALVLILGITPTGGTGPSRLLVLEAVPTVLPGLLLVFVFSWAIATIVSFVNVYLQDTQHLMDVGAQIMFFLTPIMYPPEVLVKNGLSWLLVVNPANLFMELIRTPLLSGAAPPLHTYVTGVGVTAATVGLACFIVAWLQKRVIFQM